MRYTTILILGAVALASCAPASQMTQVADNAMSETGRRCFSTSGIEIIQNETARTLYVRSRDRQALQLDTASDCFTKTGRPTYGFRPLGGAEQALCVGQPIRVDLTSSAIGQRTCQATVTARLSDEQVAALPDRLRP